jgi:hypothetical protein
MKQAVTKTPDAFDNVLLLEAPPDCKMSTRESDTADAIGKSSIAMSTGHMAKDGSLRSQFIPGPIPYAALHALRDSRSPATWICFLLVLSEQRKTLRIRGPNAWVALPREALATMGVDRRQKHRALVQLEQLHVVEVQRVKGHSSRVRLPAWLAGLIEAQLR